MAPSRRLLVVDALAGPLDAIASMAAEQGWHAFREASPARAIRDLRSHAPDVLAVRLELPMLNGRQVIRAAHTVDRELPIVVYSDEADLETAISLMRAGAFDCVLQPLMHLHELGVALERAAAASDALRERREMQSELDEARASQARQLEAEAVIRQRALARLERPMKEIFGDLHDLKKLSSSDEMLAGVDKVLSRMLTIRRVLDRAEHDSTMSGTHALSLEPFHIQRVVEFARDAVLKQAHDKGVELAFFVPPGLPPHRGDPQHLRSALIGLIEYLLRDMSSGCVHVRVVTEAQDYGPTIMRFEVSDHEGSAPPKGPNVLDRYLPGDDPSRTDTPAMELSMTVRTVQLMGADLFLVQERAVGRMFTFQAAFLNAKNDDEALADAGLPPSDVLVVADAGPSRRAIGNELSKLGMRVGVAGSAEQAVQMAIKAIDDDRPFAAVCISLNIPDRSELVEAIDALQPTPGQIFLARAGEFAATATGYLILRPPRRDDLIRVLERVLNT